MKTKYSHIGLILGIIVGFALPFIFPSLLIFDNNYGFETARQLGTLGGNLSYTTWILPILLGLIGFSIGKLFRKNR